MKYIDAHVHITPEASLGRRNERFGTQLENYGYLKKGDGGFYIMPPYMMDSSFTEDTLIHLMDVYDIDQSVILQSLLSPQNEAVAHAIEKYQNRLSGAMILEPVDGWREELAYWYKRGLRIIKFEMRSYTDQACYPDICYDDKRMLSIFEEAEKRRMAVTIDPAPVDFPVYQPDALWRAVKLFPNLRFVICHLAYPYPIDTVERRKRWEKMLSIAALPNCWLDVSALPDLFDREGWPYPTALDLLRQAKDLLGPMKLVWGSDITGTLNRATYPQMIEMFRRAECFSDSELEYLFYENAKIAYQLS